MKRQEEGSRRVEPARGTAIDDAETDDTTPLHQGVGEVWQGERGKRIQGRAEGRNRADHRPGYVHRGGKY